MATQYKAEYAKSGRSSCKKCSKAIPDGALRIGPLVQSPHFDGKVPLWHHFECLAAKAVALIDAAQVDGYFGLRPEHQTQIDDLIAANRNPKAAVKEDKKAAKASKELSEVPGEINVEAAKSGRSSCRKCFDSIAQVWPLRSNISNQTRVHIVSRAPSA
jgi:poly [ADP-ribose] polymerase